jgi:hypothetical protein
VERERRGGVEREGRGQGYEGNRMEGKGREWNGREGERWGGKGGEEGLDAPGAGPPNFFGLEPPLCTRVQNGVLLIVALFNIMSSLNQVSLVNYVYRAKYMETNNYSFCYNLNMKIS